MQNTTTSTNTTGRPGLAQAAALLSGPALVVAGMAATPWEPEKTTLSYHEALAASPTQAQIAALLLAFGYALLGLSALTTLRRIERGRSRKLWGFAAAFSFLGATLMPGILVTDFYDLAMAQTLPAADAARASDASQDLALAGLLMFPALLGFVLGPVLVAVTAVRAKVVGLWAPIMIVAGFVLSVAVFHPAAMVGGGLALLAAYAGVASGLAKRDAEAQEADDEAGHVSEGYVVKGAWSKESALGNL